MKNIRRKVSFSVNGKPISTNDFIGLIEKYWKGEFRFEETEYHNQYRPVLIECNKHGLLKVTPKYAFSYKHPCDKCSRDLVRSEQFERLLELAVRKHGDKFDYSEVDYKNGTNKVELKCPRHGRFLINFNDHANKGVDCSKCVIENSRLTLDAFVKKAKEIHGNRYNYSKVSFETSSDTVTIICEEHGEFTQRASSHTGGNGCKQCFQLNTLRSNTEDFVKKAIEKHGKKYDYSKVDYITSRTKVEIICSKHGSFYQTPFSHLTGFSSCGKCRESKGERMISNMLDKLNINHVQEHRLAGFRYAYDFYLPDYGVLVEYHGIQHYKPVEKFGGIESFHLTKIRDNSKIELAKEQGLKLIVLNHEDLNKGQLFKRLKEELISLGVLFN